MFRFLKEYFRVFGRVGKRDSQENPVFGAKTWFLQRLGAKTRCSTLIPTLDNDIEVRTLYLAPTTFPQKTNGAEPTVRMWRTYPVCSQLEGGRYGDTGGPMTSLVFLLRHTWFRRQFYRI